MTVLANNRRELFVQLLAQGFPAVDAHEKAGYRRNEGNACNARTTSRGSGATKGN